VADVGPGPGPNAVARMLGLLGDEWTLLVIQQALLGATRYGEFRERLPISHAVLTRRLRVLTEEGILERREYQPNPPRSEYLLTRRGGSLWPVLVSIWAWERRWVPAHAEPLPAMVHTGCGAAFTPLVTCSGCAHPADGETVVAQWGPSGSWQRSIPAPTTRRRATDSAAGLFPQTMSVLGNRWGFAILVAAFVGMSRFTQFQAHLGAPPGSVADRLAILGANGVLVADGGHYRLTEKGRALFGVLVTALRWAQRWYTGPEGLAVVLTHTGCGGSFQPVLVCGECAQPLRGGHIAVREIQRESR